MPSPNKHPSNLSYRTRGKNQLIKHVPIELSEDKDSNKECWRGGKITKTIVTFKGIIYSFESLRCQHFTKAHL